MKPIKFSLIASYKFNVVRMFMGLVMLLLCAYSVFVLIKGGEVGGLQLVLLPVFFFAGILYVILGLGKNPISFLGDAYVEINDETIKVKPAVKAEEWQIKWADISEIRIKVTAIVFNNDTSKQLSFDKLSKNSEEDLKEIVIALAKEKNITLT